jgi:hypothetical protein
MMAIGWLALLKGVPWAGVISTAPLVADGAKQLWKAVSRKPVLPESAVRPDASHTTSIAALETRVFALEAGTDDLHAQMIKSSELIKALADQNAQLVERVEAQRVRLLWLSGVIAVMAIVVLAMVLFR